MLLLLLNGTQLSLHKTILFECYNITYFVITNSVITGQCTHI